MSTRTLRDALWILAFAGLTAASLRFVEGLGAVTALSDRLPWGLWKIVNMVAGVALSTGGFFFAGAVHVFRIERLKPLLRPALLVACLGYASSCLALFLDIGRPFRIWHPIVSWNLHSFLFEVSWCVMLYFTITLMEVLPIALEKRGHSRLLKLLHAVSPFIVVIGITLSTLHHTTLGSLFLVSPTRLHPLWYTTWLPVQFILSAAGAGILSVVLVSYLVGKLYRRPIPDAPIRVAASISAVVLSVYFVSKVADLAIRGRLGLLVSGQWESFLWMAEVLLGVVVPVAIVAAPRLRRQRRWLGTAALLGIAGLLLNRLDVGIFGFFRTAGTIYFPSAAEIAVTLGIPAAAGLGFFAFIERFRVFELVDRVRRAPVSFERVSLIFVVTVSVSVGLFTLPARADADAGVAVAAPTEIDAADRLLMIDGDRNGVGVRFPHRLHSEPLGGEDSCRLCHHVQKPSEPVASCHECHASMAGAHEIFDHDLHVAGVAKADGITGGVPGNRTCRVCHPTGRPETGKTARACSSCHQGGKWDEVTERAGMAPAFVDAMHGLCGRCHDVEPGGRCEICH